VEDGRASAILVAWTNPNGPARRSLIINWSIFPDLVYACTVSRMKHGNNNDTLHLDKSL